ncbi:MAG TPA: hypothetical protein VMS56_06580 [Thermoanaerobaculia bacterium]|nr:hypothetical protein [Thermoanaerobaculia bacterium]
MIPGEAMGGNLTPPAAADRSVTARRSWPFLLATALFVAIRLPLLLPSGLFQGWHSDAAIFGLMGKRMLEGEISLFFWGQNYMGPLTSAIVAAWALLLRPVVDSPTVWPLALRLATMSAVWGGIALIRAGARWHVPAAAELLALLLAIGPPLLYRSSLVTLGPEMVLLAGGLLFWMAARHLAAPNGAGMLDGTRGRFLFGLAAGIGWWMNQGIVFFLIGIGCVVIGRTEGWARFRGGIRLRDRLLFRGEALGWPPLSPAARAGLILLESIPLGLLALYLLHNLVTPAVRPLFHAHPIAEPLAMLGLIHLAAAFVQRESWTRPRAAGLRRIAAHLAPYAAGFLLGWAPVWLGAIAGWYPKAETFEIRINRPSDVLASARRLATGLSPDWLGLGRGAIGVAALGSIVLVTCRLGWRHRVELGRLIRLEPHRYGIVGLAAATAGANVAYYLVTQSHERTIHYLMASVPMLALLFSMGIAELWATMRTAGGRVAAALAFTVLVASMATGAMRLNAALLAEPDPRAIIREIERRGYSVCYAETGVAYELQYLSGESVRMIVWKSMVRNPAEAERLRAAPGPKCVVGSDGTVTELEE